MTTAATTLYLSRLVPDLRSRRARWLVSHPGKLYAVLLEAFHDQGATHHAGNQGGDRSLLFRIEDSREQQAILVQSVREPDWNRLQQIDPYLLSAHESPACKAFTPQPQEGQPLRFRLRANPTRSEPGAEITPGRRKRGTVRSILGDAEQRAWLVQKLSAAAEVEDMRLIDEGNRPIQPSSGRGALCISVLYDGILIVKDPDALVSMVAKGIGRGRAYGFGLLSLARA